MTAPYTPMPNPGGRARETVRKTVATWIYNGSIAGLVNVYAGPPPTTLYDTGAPGSMFTANVSVHVFDGVRAFRVNAGPDDFGGYFATYQVELALKHRCADVSFSPWDAAEDDHDRILDAIMTRLMGPGRDLGRPDVILQAAAHPRETAIRFETDPPVYSGGVRDQWSRIFFTVTQYMQQEPAEHP